MRAAFTVLKSTYDAWNEDHAQRLAAALAYYVTFALAPFLIVVVQITALILGAGNGAGHHSAARTEIISIVARSAGKDAGAALDGIVTGILSQQSASIWTAVISWTVLVLSAAGLFGAVQDALNAVFGNAKKSGGIWLALRERFASFAMLGGIALLLIVSLLINAIVTSLSSGLERVMPSFVTIFQVADVVLTFVLTMVLVAIIYKWLPAVALPWRPVLAGALVTAVLFGIGEVALGWYLGHAGWTSEYGAAGSLVLILLWVYYSAQIFLIGAEFTKVYARGTTPHTELVDPLRAA
ncbi:MAG: YihY/virulence factor BrkB family protein [Vulcanimicrobiaceae bacterium]